MKQELVQWEQEQEERERELRERELDRDKDSEIATPAPPNDMQLDVVREKSTPERVCVLSDVPCPLSNSNCITSS